MRKERWIAPFLLAAAMAACEAAPTRPEEPGDETARAIEALGYRSDGWREWGDYVVVEGDVRLKKSVLDRGPMRPLFQFQTQNLVGSLLIHQVRVDLSLLSGEAEWQDAARAAMAQWSGIQGSYIRMTEGTSAHITVEPLCFPETIPAAVTGDAPSGSNPGALVLVNTCTDSELDEEEKIAAVLHGLGHTIGFMHTDWLEHDDDEGLHVPGTPYSGGDDASVMNRFPGDRSLSDYDRVAARLMYPLPPPTITVVNNGGHPQITWNYPASATGQFTLRLLHNRHERFGRLPPETLNEVTNLSAGTGGTSFHDVLRGWTGTSSCSVMTTNYTRKEAWLYEVTIQYPNGAAVGTWHAPVGTC